MPAPRDPTPQGDPSRTGDAAPGRDAPAAEGTAPGRREVFQYTVLQVVPSVPRGEALNVGVVLHCRRCRFLGARVLVDDDRLRALDPDLDLDALRAHLDGLVRVAAGDPAAGAVAQMDRSDRFGWLAAPSDTIVQPSPVHTGVCEDPQEVLDRLLAQLVQPR